MTEKFSYKGKSICYTFRYGGAVPKKIYRGLAVFFCAFIGVFSAISVLLLARRHFSAAAVAAAAALFCLIPGAFFLRIRPLDVAHRTADCALAFG